MSNRFILIVAVVLGLLGGIFWFSKPNTSNNNGVSSVQPSSHTQGQGTTGVNLTEYGDLQCPACASYFPIVNAIKAHYGDQITFQFRHFPLIQIHPNAMAAHRAAEAAGNQDKFWQMHDLMYQRQKLWTDANNPAAIFESYAAELDLDIERYKSDVASESTLAIINADISEGKKLGATSTPTFVLNGKKIENPRSFEDFTKIIDEAIEEQKQSAQ